jgi:hypothetical protein
MSTYPTTKRYKDLRRIYWILLAIGAVFVALSFFAQNNFADSMEIFVGTMAVAYAMIISAIVLDFAKIRPLVKAHQKEMRGGSGKKSPKQLKHEQEAAEQARQMEEFNKAKKQARRRVRRAVLGLAAKRKDADAVGADVTMDADAADADAADAEAVDAPAANAPGAGAADVDVSGVDAPVASADAAAANAVNMAAAAANAPGASAPVTRAAEVEEQT